MNLFCSKTSWIVFCFDFKGQLYLTNRGALTVLCFVVKHAESGYSTKEV